MRVLLAKLGCFSPLVELLGTGTPAAKRHACWTLDMLTELMADCNVEVSHSSPTDVLKPKPSPIIPIQTQP
jgi:hypothetical protein